MSNDRLERMRQAQSQKGLTPMARDTRPPQQAPKPPVPPPPPKPPGKPKGGKPPMPVQVGSEQVKAGCGCVVEFAVFAPDPGRDRRRDKVAGKPCDACRPKLHEARMAADQQAARERRKTGWTPRGKRHLGRLPDGSAFVVAYSAPATTWTGTLTIPGTPGFTGSASALFTLQANLDRQYRAWLEANPAAEAVTQTELTAN